MATIDVTNGLGYCHLTNWMDFVNLLRIELREFEYIFRGQKKSSYRLKPSFYRHSRIITAAQHLENFKRATQGKLGNEIIRQFLDDDKWWCMGQHYNLETPLMDWTYSPFVSLFFAFEDEYNDNERRSVWAFYPKGNLNTIFNSIRVNNPSYRDDFSYIDPVIDINKRMQSQSGVFLQFNNDIDLEDWVKNLVNIPTVRPLNQTAILIKIDIDNADREGCLKELNRMNINHKTIYPDIDGAGKYSNVKSIIQGYY